MKASLRFSMLPAGEGDCLLAQARDEGGSSTSVLVDGGRSGRYKLWKPQLDRLLGERRVIDLLVVTHIDADHIAGIIKFLEDPERNVAVSNIWFNGHTQIRGVQANLKQLEAFSAQQADQLSRLLRQIEIPWNAHLSGAAIYRGATAPFSLGSFKMTVVTPDQQRLAAVASRWGSVSGDLTDAADVTYSTGLESFGRATIDVEELARSNDVADTAKPNGGSIGLLLEAFGYRILLTGDCHADDLAAGLGTLGATPEHPIELSLLKVSHHGAETNTSSRLLSMLKSQYYCFSTDGRRREHPSDKVIAKILKSCPDLKTLGFNYGSSAVDRWDDLVKQRRYGYSVARPGEDDAGMLTVTFGDQELWQ